MSMSRRPESLSPSPTNHHSSNPNSTTSHRSPSPSFMDDDDISTASPQPPPSLPPATTTHKPTFPAREDCWSEEATRTLIDAWGNRYIELNRGNLRQKHWQDVAAAVNARHGHIKKARRTDIQCKNRIDTLKKKYKIEKSKSLQSKSNYTSDWPFFSKLDTLIGSSFKISPPATTPAPLRKLRPPPAMVAPPAPLPLLPHPSSVPVGPRSKRPAPAKIDDSFFRRNFSRIAAAAAAVEAGEESDASRSRSSGGRDGSAACRELAEAIGKLGKIYEKVEEGKQRQLIELEKQRMEFAKDLEIQRMKFFMESQVQLHKIKRAKSTSDSEPGLSGVIKHPSREICSNFMLASCLLLLD